MLFLLSKIENYRKTWLNAVHLFCWLPLSYLVYGYNTNALGINPYATIMKTTGVCAIALLLLCLMATPLRRWLCWGCKYKQKRYGKRLSDWNYLILSRKLWGNYCALYASLHAAAYFYLDMDFDLEEISYDLKTRSFILVGVLAWLCLLPLLVTSLKWFQKRMGKYWRRLHRLVYAIGCLAVLHVGLEAKPTDNTPYLYALLLIILLGHRITVLWVKRLRKKEDTGMEVYRNQSNANIPPQDEGQ